MSSFTTRVELHKANGDDYEVLHKAMQAEGYEQTIRSDDGTLYRLPTAEYNLIASITRQDALDRAKRAADKTKREHSILLTESNGRKWSGLPIVANATTARR